MLIPFRNPEELALVDGFGEKKVQRWCNTVREPFRVKKAAKRGVSREASRATLSRDVSLAEGMPLVEAEPVPESLVTRKQPAAVKNGQSSDLNTTSDAPPDEIDDADAEEALLELHASPKPSKQASSSAAKPKSDGLSEGVSAALARLRQGG